MLEIFTHKSTVDKVEIELEDTESNAQTVWLKDEKYGEILILFLFQTLVATNPTEIKIHENLSSRIVKLKSIKISFQGGTRSIPDQILALMPLIEPRTIISPASETAADQVASLLLWIELAVGALVFFPVILLVLWNKWVAISCQLNRRKSIESELIKV